MTPPQHPTVPMPQADPFAAPPQPGPFAPPPSVAQPAQQWLPTYGSYGPYAMGSPPPNYMGLAIASLVVSFLLAGLLAIWAGIIAVVQAGKVHNRWYAGDYEGAMAASRKARTWSIVGFVLGAVLLVLIVMLLVAADPYSTY